MDNEKLYRVISHSGAWNLVLGIIVLVTGVVSFRKNMEEKILH